VVEDHFVIKHEVRRKLLAGQKRRSYLKSRAAPGAYEGMVKGAGLKRLSMFCFLLLLSWAVEGAPVKLATR
ncbi:hypothetical protein ACB268_12820, partial [Aeromonas sanarellii]